MPMNKARRNARIIVQYTTAYPFKLPECSVVCVYCLQDFEEPHLFRRHMEDEHPEVGLTVAFAHIPDGYIKVDVTELRCRVCKQKFENVGAAAEHLLKSHRLNLDLEHNLGVQPFKFPRGKWMCALCETKFAGLRALSRHTQSHFSKYTCHTCGKSYFSSSSLKLHLRVSHIGDQKICVKCKRTFKTLEERRKHISESPRCWSFACKSCGQRFVSHAHREAHRLKEHGGQKRMFPCTECKEIFPDRYKYNYHYKITHTDDYFTCTCGRKFDTKRNMEKHRVVHTKEKLFPCTVCSKEFSRKKNLVQHMWIHSEHKRFECIPCNKQFNQRVSWKTHMKSYHPDVEIPPYIPTSVFEQGKNNNLK